MAAWQRPGQSPSKAPDSRAASKSKIALAHLVMRAAVCTCAHAPPRRGRAARPHTAQPKCPYTRPPRAVGSVSSSNSHIHMHNAHARTPHATLLAHHACKGTLCHPATPTPRSPSSQAPQLNLESVQCTRDHALRDVGLAVSQQSLLFTYSGDERGGDSRFMRGAQDFGVSE